LTDHGGKVLTNPVFYDIWWGPQSGFVADQRTIVQSWFKAVSVAGNPWLASFSQYLRGSQFQAKYHGTSLYDTVTAPPTSNPAVATIVSEACNVITANGLTADPNGLYFVMTSNFPSTLGYCAYHSSGLCQGVTIQVAYNPNTNGIAGCDPYNLFNCNSYSQGARSLVNVLSHEMVEAITDPHPGVPAWIDPSDCEIADKCAWKFSKCIMGFQVQELWSNAGMECVG